MRMPLLVVLSALIAACTGGGVDAADTSVVPAPSSTTSVAPTTSSSTTTPSTTTTTTSTLPTTTTVAPIEPPEESPTVALDSFTWTFSTTIGTEATPLLSVEARGTHVADTYDCEITAGFEGIDFTTRLVVLEDAAYYDDGTGEGLVEVELDSPEVTANEALCAGSDVFWADITGGESLPDGGEAEDRNDVATRRLDLTGVIDQAGALGLFTGVEGVDFDELDFWVADPGGWIVGIEMSALLAAEALEDITGSTVVDEGVIAVELDIADSNDPSLAVTGP